MAYTLNDGEDGQVENEQYCMKKSFNARNVDSMSEKMGYHDMSDLANAAKGMQEKSTPANNQMNVKVADSAKNDRHGSAE